MKLTKRLDQLSFKKAVDEHPGKNSALHLAMLIQDFLTSQVGGTPKIIRRMDFLFHDFMAVKARPEDVLEGLANINDYLFKEKSFRCVTEPPSVDHYFIGKALENRVGAPLTVALIYRDLAQRIQCPVEFVNFPGHTIVKLLYESQLLFLDPAQGGKVVSVSELQKKLAQKFGKSIFLKSPFLETPSELHLVNHLLAKLKSIYFDAQRWTEVLGVLDALLLFNPERVGERKERGLLLYQLGLFDEAYDDLTFFINRAAPSAELEKLKSFVSHMKNPEITPLH